MLYTNHLPLNSHEFYVKNNHTITPYCNHPECNKEKIDESLYHYICECQNYNDHRNTYIQNIKYLYQQHNILALKPNSNTNKEKNIKKYKKFINDKHNPGYLKQLLFPPPDMNMDRRIQIIKQTICYIRNTNRFSNYKWSRYVDTICIL